MISLFSSCTTATARSCYGADRARRRHDLVNECVLLATALVVLSLHSVCESKEASSADSDDRRRDASQQQPQEPENAPDAAGVVARSPCAQESYVFLEHISRIEADERALAAFERGGIASSRRADDRSERPTCLVFVRREASATDRLCLAVCQPAYRFMLLTTIELRQFGRTVFTGDVKVRVFGPAVCVVEIRLPKETYTDLDSLIEGLRKGQSEAIAFHREFDLPPLDTLELWSRNADSGMSARPEVDPRRFLYVGSCACMVK